MHGLYWKQARGVPRGIQGEKSRKDTAMRETGLKHKQAPKRTEPVVRKDERPLSTCHTRRKCYFETFIIW